MVRSSHRRLAVVLQDGNAMCFLVSGPIHSAGGALDADLRGYGLEDDEALDGAPPAENASRAADAATVCRLVNLLRLISVVVRRPEGLRGRGLVEPSLLSSRAWV